ncbi:MAG TPA: glycine--tRNA ligase subunit beta, partial [Gammaproteobacteria bacterium]|nr:glycine--tRNA ligase subunit beta [Gammaproteobacteria bacterium]
MSAAQKKTVKAKLPATLPFLVEIGTEELPPKSLRKLALAFLEHFEAQAIAKGLLPAGNHDEVFFSPRRLAIYAPALYPRQPDRSEEKLGPAVAAAYDAAGMPTKAAEGFAKSCNTTVDKLSRKQTDKGERLAFTLEIKGETAAALLPGMVQEALSKLPAPKRMRWGAGTVEFVRPVHWVLMLLGDKVLKSEILGLAAGDKTYGHRFHHPAAIPIKNPADYRRSLEKFGKVLVEDRDGTLAKKIGSLVVQAATKAKGKARLERPLLEEVAALVEWPVPLVGDFDPRFLALPEEVIEVVLQGQQRYFPLRDAHGKLLPHFVTISNVQSKEPKEVKRGNERVIVPRLTDAMFFWDLDKG